MSKVKPICRWSPHDSNIFVVGAEDLRLYEVIYSTTKEETSYPLVSNAVPTQRRRSLRLLHVASEMPQLKCLAWFPRPSNPLMIAIGLGCGKILLTNYQEQRQQPLPAVEPNASDLLSALEMKDKSYDDNPYAVDLSSRSISGGIIKEFVPKYSRPCNAIAWNPENPSQLAAGLEKVRSDFCTLVWDVNQISANVSHNPSTSSSTRNVSSTRSTHHRLDNSLVFRERITKPIHELANSEAIVALSWVPSEASCLATGTGFKWLRIYDLRSNSNNAPLSVVAHTKAVQGVVFDIHRPHILATYSDAPNEPVKIWDIRKIDGCSGPICSLHSSSKFLSQIEWSPTKSGILATASLEENWISLWDINKATSGIQQQVVKPFKKRYTTEPILSFSWQHVATSSVTYKAKHRTNQEHPLDQLAFPNRLLTATANGVIEDISVYDSSPLSISCTGVLSFGCGKLLFEGSCDFSSSPSVSPIESKKLLQQHIEEDISTRMFRLAVSGYSVDAHHNLELFSSKKDGLSISFLQNKEMPSWIIIEKTRKRQLEQMWQWIYHVEQLYDDKVTYHRHSIAESSSSSIAHLNNNPLELLPACSTQDLFLTAGVENLLRSYNGNGANHTFTVSESRNDSSLCCTTFDGPGRRLALLFCNWDPDMGSSPNVLDREWNSLESSSACHDLSSIIERMKREGQYERAAAVSFFHGDLRNAILLLQAAASISSENPSPNSLWEGKHAEVLELVAMAIAGFSTALNHDSRLVVGGGQSSLWMEICQKLVNRRELNNTLLRRGRYLHAICIFLYSVLSFSSSSGSRSSSQVSSGTSRTRTTMHHRLWKASDSNASTTSSLSISNAYHVILEDTALALADRVAFACHFLSGYDLERFIQVQARQEEKRGSLDALLLTGLGEEGIKLLQAYLDKTGDIQTLALVSAHLPKSRVYQHEQLNNWIYSYQQLLNMWRLWHERALFDVARSQLEKKRLGISQVLDKEFNKDRRDYNSKEHLLKEDQQLDEQQHQVITVPPQLYVRCNFCGLSLALSQLLRTGCSHGSWLTRAKPKLTCCPSCRKPLPLCSLCLLPLGALNPYLEQASHQARLQEEYIRGSSFSSSQHQQIPLFDNFAELSSIPFVEWFTWCQTCKHGGHSHHIASWFKSHQVCPVTDCFCKCKSLDHSNK